MVDDAVAEIMLATQEEAVAAALSEYLKMEEKEKKEEVLAQAPAEPKNVAADSDGINRVLFKSQNQ